MLNKHSILEDAGYILVNSKVNLINGNTEHLFYNPDLGEHITHIEEVQRA